MYPTMMDAHNVTDNLKVLITIVAYEYVRPAILKLIGEY